MACLEAWEESKAEQTTQSMGKPQWKIMSLQTSSQDWTTRNGLGALGETPKSIWAPRLQGWRQNILSISLTLKH